MSEWLSIIGIGENGLKDLAGASREALDRAEVVFGSPRHLALVDHPGKRPWPVPFSLASLLALRGRPVATAPIARVSAFCLCAAPDPTPGVSVH